jgi:hypothetical protein
LPEELQRRLESRQTAVRGQTRSLLDLLGEYRDYSQFRDAQGQWDRESLRSTLLAMFLASRYLLMHEDSIEHAETAVNNLQPDGVKVPLSPEDFHPGESLATYFGRKADAAFEKADAEGRRADAATEKADAEGRRADAEGCRADAACEKATAERHRADAATEKADAALVKAEAEGRRADAATEKADTAFRAMQQMITRRRDRGHTDAEIAEDLGCTVEELQQRFPAQP